MYVQCLYQDKVVIECPLVDQWSKDGRPSPKTDEFRNELHSCFSNFIMLYSCADKLRDVVSANLVIDELIRFSDKANKIPRGEGLLHLAYGCAPENSHLHALVRDLIMYESLDTFFDGSIDRFPKELLQDLAKLYSKIKKDSLKKQSKRLRATG